MILARRSYAEKLQLPILGVVRSYAVAGVPPDVMGIGPAYAIPEALKKAGSCGSYLLIRNGCLLMVYGLVCHSFLLI